MGRKLLKSDLDFLKDAAFVSTAALSDVITSYLEKHDIDYHGSAVVNLPLIVTKEHRDTEEGAMILANVLISATCTREQTIDLLERSLAQVRASPAKPKDTTGQN